MDNIFNYISEAEYKLACEGLKDGETKNIFKDKDIEIDIKKVGRKIYKFICHYSHEKSFVNCVADMYLKRPA